jgi:hypothetical protein
MATHELMFEHPGITSGPLLVKVKPEQITWAYGLNTKNYSTFGGEVVQILSMYVDDLVVSGTVGTYKEIEAIYGWFINYMNIATQGHKSNAEGYDTRPVTMYYPHRQWKFSIYPKSMPGFRYGRDVVAPSWQLSAAVSEYPDSLENQIISNKMFAGEAKAGNFEVFGTATGAIGYNENNPWSSITQEQAASGEGDKQLAKIEEWMAKAYDAGYDYSEYSPDFSTPLTFKNNNKKTKPKK